MAEGVVQVLKCIRSRDAASGLCQPYYKVYWSSGPSDSFYDLGHFVMRAPNGLTSITKKFLQFILRDAPAASVPQASLEDMGQLQVHRITKVYSVNGWPFFKVKWAGTSRKDMMPFENFVEWDDDEPVFTAALLDFLASQASRDATVADHLVDFGIDIDVDEERSVEEEKPTDSDEEFVDDGSLAGSEDIVDDL